MKKTNFTFFSTVGASYLKSLSLLSMILLMLMGPVAELSALDNPFLPPLKQKDRLVESLNADIARVNAELSNYNTQQLIEQNLASISSLHEQLIFFSTFKNFANENPQLETVGILQLINLNLSLKQIASGGNEPRTAMSIQEAQMINRDFDNGVFRGGVDFDEYVEYAKL